MVQFIVYLIAISYIATETTAESSEPQISCHMNEYQRVFEDQM